jgi:lipopolysaccharide transport system permease protein
LNFAHGYVIKSVIYFKELRAFFIASSEIKVNQKRTVQEKGTSVSSQNEHVFLIQPSKGWRFLNLKELWQFRELVYFLTWRDIKVRYKQTVIGAAWSLLKPVMTMVVFTIIFNKFAKIDSEGLPYPLFAFAGLLPWNYFSESISRGGLGLVGNANLVSKVYFPRLIIPLASVTTPVVDFLLSFVVFLGLMMWFGIRPGFGILYLPLLLLFTLITAFGVSLWLSAVNVRYRDVGYAIPVMIQFWLYASPVAYPVSLVPEKWRFFYGLNPMVGVIEGFRWALLGKEVPDSFVMIMSGVIVFVLLGSGILYFKHTERTFADVI